MGVCCSRRRRPSEESSDDDDDDDDDEGENHEIVICKSELEKLKIGRTAKYHRNGCRHVRADAVRCRLCKHCAKKPGKPKQY